MGIYTIANFETKEDATKYYTSGANKYSERLTKNLSKYEETKDRDYLSKANHCAYIVQVFCEYLEEVETHEW